MYRNCIKRILDFCIALCALSLLWPILLVITIFLHFANKGAGAFFTQERPGKNAKIFRVIKYKTMTDERDADGKLLPEAQRLTKIGKIVRYLSIQELHQLFFNLRDQIGQTFIIVTHNPQLAEMSDKTFTMKDGIIL